MTPGRLAGGYAIVAAAVGFVLVAVGGLATVLGSVGVLVFTVGCLRGHGRAVTVGAAGLFGAVVVAAVAGEGQAVVLGAGGATLVAWTTGQTAVELGTVSGARTRALEAVHAAGTTALAAGAVGLALAPQYLTVDPDPLGVALLLAGALTLTVATRQTVSNR